MRRLHTWLSHLEKKTLTSARRASRRQKRTRLSLPHFVECLEDRSVPATLTLTIPASSMSEAAGTDAVGALLNRTGDLSQPLTVSLASSDTTEATVPATASFAVGQQEVGFSISAVDDTLLDGTQTVTISATADVTQGQPFGLDSSYGVNGLAPTRLDMSIQPPVQAITLQQDGKAIVASENTADNGWHVQRFNTNGTLDTTFGGGFVNTPNLGSFAVPHAAIVQPNGKILIGGKVSGGTGAAILVRYNSDGSLDTSFGVGGRANLASLTNSWVTDIALRPDGRILLGLGQNGGVQSLVAQLNANGTFDSTFGSGGVSALNLGWWAQDVEVLADGTFLVGGSFRMPVHVAKVQPNGVGLVTSFGTSGVASLDFGTDGSSVAGMSVDNLGRIIVGADVFNFVGGNSTPADFAAGRLNPNGTPDNSFAGDGTAVLNVSGSELATDLIVQQDGKVVLGGRIMDTSNVIDSAMGRFNANGSPDTTFDGDGFYRQSLVNTFSPDQITSMALQDDGKLLAITGWGTDWRIARFHLGQQQFTLSSSDTIDVLDNENANRPPVAVLWQYGTPEDTPLNDFLRASDPDGDPITYIIVTQPAQGTVQITNANTGTFTYTPALNFNGTVSFTFKVNDGQVDSNIATGFVTVSPINDAPVAQDRSFTINEDPPSPFLQGTLLATDVDSSTLTYSIVTSPTNGTISNFNTATGAFTYRPGLNFNGTATFTYRATDGSLNSNTATVTITVNPVNDAPFPSPVVQELTTPEDTPRSGQLAANDPEGDQVTFTLEAGPSNGTLTLSQNGAFTFTPNANFNGIGEFVYRASDPSGASNLGGVRITVTPVNDAPTAVNDTFSVAEDGVLSVSASPVTRLRMVSQPGDFIGQGLTYDFTPANASFDADTNFDNGVSLDVDPPAPGEFWFLDFAAANEVLLTPGTYLNAERFPFQSAGKPGLNVSGNGRGSNTLTGQFNVYDVVRNAALDDVLSFAASFEQHSEGASPALLGWIIFNSTFGAGGGIVANDTDVESDLLLGALLVSGPSNGTLTFKGDGTFSYTPNANFHGTDSFTYRTNDGAADSNVATVTINVTPVNDAPVAAADTYSAIEDTPLTVPLATGLLNNDSDVDGDSLTAQLVSGPSATQGTLALDPNGSFVFTPTANFNGAASFTYRASDGTALSDVVTVTLNVAPVNDAPTAGPDTAATDEDTAATVNVLANDTDVDGNPLTITAVTQGSHGSVVINADGTATYTPAADYNGPDSFTYTVSDGSGGTATATVSMTVRPVNDAPVARNDSYAIGAGAVLTVSAAGVLTNDSDVDGDVLTATLVSGPANGTLTLNANGSFTYTPAAGFSGTDSFSYRASDGNAVSNTALVNIVVSPTEPTVGKVTGKGRIDRGARLFNISVQTRENRNGLSFEGNFIYFDRANRIFLRSTSITFIRVESDGQRATIRGTAKVNGVAGYTFEVTVADRGEPGVGADTFRVTINGPRAFSYDSAMFSTNNGLLDGGNLQVHKPPRGGK